MSKQIKITAIVGAYLTSQKNIAHLVEACEDHEMHRDLVGSILTYSAWDMSKTWAKVGEAEITVTLASKDEQVAAAITALRGQLDLERAKFLQTQSEILERINKLQALEMTVEA
jgi:hypothetical protein